MRVIVRRRGDHTTEDGGSRPPHQPLRSPGPFATKFTEWDHHFPETYGATPTNELTSKHYGATPTNELIYGIQQNIGLTFRGARFGFDTAFVGTIEPKMGGRAPPSAASLARALCDKSYGVGPPLARNLWSDPNQ